MCVCVRKRERKRHKNIKRKRREESLSGRMWEIHWKESEANIQRSRRNCVMPVKNLFETEIIKKRLRLIAVVRRVSSILRHAT